jgi:hypothetical protein
MKEVELKSALLLRADAKLALGSFIAAKIVLTNVESVTCEADKPDLQTLEDFAVVIALVETFDKKGPEKTFIYSALFDDKIFDTNPSQRTFDVGFKKFTIALHQLNATKDRVYLKTDVTKGTCKFVRSPESTRLILNYEDKQLSVDGDVKLTICSPLSIEAPKK